MDRASSVSHSLSVPTGPNNGSLAPLNYAAANSARISTPCRVYNLKTISDLGLPKAVRLVPSVRFAEQHQLLPVLDSPF